VTPCSWEGNRGSVGEYWQLRSDLCGILCQIKDPELAAAYLVGRFYACTSPFKSSREQPWVNYDIWILEMVFEPLILRFQVRHLVSAYVRLWVNPVKTLKVSSGRGIGRVPPPQLTTRFGERRNFPDSRDVSVSAGRRSRFSLNFSHIILLKRNV